MRVEILLVAKNEKPSCAQDVGHMEFGGHFSPVPSPSFHFVSSIPSVLIFTSPVSVLSLPPPVFCFISLFQGGSKPDAFSTQHSSRKMLGFSSEAETEVVMGSDPLGRGPSEIADR